MSEAVDKVVLESYLRKLCLSSFIRHYEAFAAEAAQSNQSYSRYLLALAEQELLERDSRRRERRLVEAKFPVVKELSTFDFAAIPQLNPQKSRQLAQGEYIDQVEPIILVGSPGLGKTHIATALAVEATRQMRRVRFYNAAALVNELLAAQAEGRLASFLNKALNWQLIVLDELGFIPFTSSGAQLMFQFCSTLYQRVALIITTNLKFADWTQLFGDERLTVALLDRLTHRAHIIEFVGESYRFRERQRRQEAL
ncbi:MAG: IS21-like element helper ATPase IstB [Chloroflexi bacterium]|nr:IS21-like element helper ATPase IstB [Chloroflexota bacterium]MCI0574905.1 IS21-like element helper ATPase IstB [Chloroflexota bacterium]MCI0647078.1 IS21-like element helper ATPase IstB [Chloroflexota bacterium]MCI0727058.1 IS21-like element helper ATPase IstB [Chloroflexota bacterium]